MLFCVRVPVWVLGYSRGAPAPHLGLAMHSDGWTALHMAAARGNRRIVRSLVAFNADVNAQDDNGCAVSACGESAVSAARRITAAVCRAGTRRCTVPQTEAVPQPSRSCCCAAPTGPSRTASGNAALRRTAEAKPQQPRARRDTPKQWAEVGGKLAEYEAGESQVHSARRLTAHSPRPLRAPSLPALLVPTDVLSVLADPAGREATQHSHCNERLAARLVVHYCTRESKCRARRARAAAFIGSAKRARARRAVPRTARGHGQELHANARAARHSESSPFRPLSLRIGFGVTGRAAAPGDG